MHRVQGAAQIGQTGTFNDSAFDGEPTQGLPDVGDRFWAKTVPAANQIRHLLRLPELPPDPSDVGHGSTRPHAVRPVRTHREPGNAFEGLGKLELLQGFRRRHRWERGRGAGERGHLHPFPLGLRAVLVHAWTHPAEPASARRVGTPGRGADRAMTFAGGWGNP